MNNLSEYIYIEYILYYMNIPKDGLSYTIAVIFTISFFCTLITMGLIIKRR